jgi:hypothetical protein
MPEEFTLTDEQVENWRKILITLPVPPLYAPIGAYAVLMPREQVVSVVKQVQEMVIPFDDPAVHPLELWELIEEKPTNIIRTRPRKPGRPIRK